MAIEVGNIPALDQQKVVGLGLAVPFLSSPTSGSDSLFKITYTTAEQIKYNMINYFLHSKGERILNPNFGSRIREFLFEPDSTQSNEILKKYIEDEINLIFPVVRLNNIYIESNPEYQVLTVRIFYSVFTSLNEFIELNIPL